MPLYCRDEMETQGIHSEYRQEKEEKGYKMPLFGPFLMQFQNHSKCICLDKESIADMY